MADPIHHQHHQQQQQQQYQQHHHQNQRNIGASHHQHHHSHSQHQHNHHHQPLHHATTSQAYGAGPNATTKKDLPANGKKTKGRVRIKMEFIHNKLRRYTTFSKRKTGIMKKAFELATLTGTQVMLLVASETGHVYTFATRKLQPMIISDAGKALIQTCLNSPDGDTNSAGGQSQQAQSQQPQQHQLQSQQQPQQQQQQQHQQQQPQNSDSDDRQTLANSMGCHERTIQQRHHQSINDAATTKDEAPIRWEPQYGQFNYNPLYNGLNSATNPAGDSDRLGGVKQFQEEDFLDDDYADEEDEDEEEDETDGLELDNELELELDQGSDRTLADADELDEITRDIEPNLPSGERNYLFDEELRPGNFEPDTSQKQATTDQQFGYAESRGAQVDHYLDGTAGGRYEQQAPLSHLNQTRIIMTTSGDSSCHRKRQVVGYQQHADNNLQARVMSSGQQTGGQLGCNVSEGGGGLFVEYQQTNRGNLLNGDLVGSGGSGGGSSNAGLCGQQNSGGLEELHSLNITNCDSETLEEQIAHFVHENERHELVFNASQNHQDQHHHNHQQQHHHDDYHDFSLVAGSNDPFSFASGINSYQQHHSSLVHLTGDANSGPATTPDLFRTSPCDSQPYQAGQQQPPQKTGPNEKASENNRKKRKNRAAKGSSDSNQQASRGAPAQDKTQKSSGSASSQNKTKQTKTSATKDANSKNSASKSNNSKCLTSSEQNNKQTDERASSKQVKPNASTGCASKSKRKANENKTENSRQVAARTANSKSGPQKRDSASGRTKPDQLKSITASNQSSSGQLNDLNGTPEYKQQLESLRKKLRMDMTPKEGQNSMVENAADGGNGSRAGQDQMKQISAGQVAQSSPVLVRRQLQTVQTANQTGAQQDQQQQPLGPNYISIQSAMDQQRAQQSQYQHTFSQQQQQQASHAPAGSLFLTATSDGGLIPVVSSSVANSMLLTNEHEILSSSSELFQHHQQHYQQQQQPAQQMPTVTSWAPAAAVPTTATSNSSTSSSGGQYQPMIDTHKGDPQGKVIGLASESPQLVAQANIASSNCAIIERQTSAPSNSAASIEAGANPRASGNELLSMMEDDQNSHQQDQHRLNFIESDPAAMKSHEKSQQVDETSAQPQLIHMAGIELATD